MRQKLRTRNAAIAPAKSAAKSGRNRIAITITPLKGFLLTLLCLGIPTVSLGAICLSLLQNNSQLNEENQELSEIASEVKAEVDSLGEEIEDLREWADTESEIPLPESAGSTTPASTTPPSTIETTSQSRKPSKNSSKSNADRLVEEGLPPRGGPSRAIDSFELLEDLRQQVPTLSQTLLSQVKPAVEEAIAKEAAYPSGLPVVGKINISSEYGVRRNPFGWGGYEVHEGIDFVGETGNIVTASGDGVVTFAGNKGGYGIAVTIDHQNGYESLYAHMSEMKVKAGEPVNRGQIIGYIGSTGRSSGPHLHYSLYKDGKVINPRQLLNLDD